VQRQVPKLLKSHCFTSACGGFDPFAVFPGQLYIAGSETLTYLKSVCSSIFLEGLESGAQLLQMVNGGIVYIKRRPPLRHRPSMIRIHYFGKRKQIEESLKEFGRLFHRLQWCEFPLVQSKAVLHHQIFIRAKSLSSWFPRQDHMKNDLEPALWSLSCVEYPTGKARREEAVAYIALPFDRPLSGVGWLLTEDKLLALLAGLSCSHIHQHV
jgi:hypothetical protein